MFFFHIMKHPAKKIQNKNKFKYSNFVLMISWIKKSWFAADLVCSTALRFAAVRWCRAAVVFMVSDRLHQGSKLNVI